MLAPWLSLQSLWAPMSLLIWFCCLCSSDVLDPSRFSCSSTGFPKLCLMIGCLCICSYRFLNEASLMSVGYSRLSLEIFSLTFFSSHVWVFPESLSCSAWFQALEAVPGVYSLLWHGPQIRLVIVGPSYEFCATIILAHLAGRTILGLLFKFKLC